MVPLCRLQRNSISITLFMEHTKAGLLPGCYSFMSGCYDIYNQFLIELKETGISYGQALDSKIIHVSFELTAIKAFKIQFPGAKITG